MAQENVKLFQEKLLESEELKAKLKAAGEAYTGDKTDAAKIAESVIIPLAKEAGLPFTVEELKAVETAMEQEGALSDKELAAVAGGRMAICLIVGINDKNKTVNPTNSLCFGLGYSK
jgi:pantothenate synthetase